MIDNKVWQTIKENKILMIFLVLLGVIAAYKPLILLSSALLLFLIYYIIFRTRSFFIAIAILLFIQQSLIKTYFRFGLSLRESMIISRADDVLWITLLVIIFLKFKEYKEEIEFENIDFTLLFLILFSFSSLFINNRSLFWGSVSILLMIKGYLMYFVGDKLKFSEGDIKRFLILYLSALILIGIIGVLQYYGLQPPLFPPGFRFGLKVVNSIFGTHTAFGSVMVIGATLTISFIIGFKKIKFLPLLFLFIWGIFLSTSRRSIISFLIVLFLLPFVTRRVSKKIYIPFLILIALIVLLFRTQVSVLVTSTIQEYFINFFKTARGELYLGMVRILKNKTIFGEGPGSYAGLISKITLNTVYRKYGLTENALIFSSDAYPAHIFGELGLGGGVLFILFSYYIFRKLSSIHKHFISVNNIFFISLSIYLKSIFIVGIAESFVSSFFEVAIKSFAFFGIFAMISSYYKHSKV